MTKFKFKDDLAAVLTGSASGASHLAADDGWQRQGFRYQVVAGRDSVVAHGVLPKDFADWVKKSHSEHDRQLAVSARSRRANSRATRRWRGYQAYGSLRIAQPSRDKKYDGVIRPQGEVRRPARSAATARSATRRR